MSYTIVEGGAIRFYTSTPFTDYDGTIVTPDVVTFTWNVQGTAATTYTYTTGNMPPDPSGMIVKDGTGDFHVDLSTAGLAGVWSYQWSGQPGESGLDTTHTSVVWDGTVTVSPSTF